MELTGVAGKTCTSGLLSLPGGKWAEPLIETCTRGLRAGVCFVLSSGGGKVGRELAGGLDGFLRSSFTLGVTSCHETSPLSNTPGRRRQSDTPIKAQ